MLSHQSLKDASLSFWIFIIPAISLVVPSGYSYGAVMLALLSLEVFWPQRQRTQLTSSDKWLLLTLALSAAVSFLSIFLEGFQTREVDQPIRFLLAGLVMLFLIRKSKSINCVWLLHGVVVGSFGAAALASYQSFVLGNYRASGHMNAIMFGNTAFLLGLLSLASVGWFAMRRQRWLAVAAVVACELGIYCSALSGTRGGWLAFPLLGFVLWHYRSILTARQLTAASVACIASVAFFLSVPQIGAARRATTALDDLARYAVGENQNSSPGLRLEIWRCAIGSFVESPLVGVGRHGTQTLKQAWVDEGRVVRDVLEFSHAHNEYLNELSLRGLLGFVSLMALYLIPLHLFTSKTRQTLWPQKVFPVCGAVIPLAYMIFGLTQAMFEHNSGLMLYLLFVVIFWVLSRQQPSQKVSASQMVSIWDQGGAMRRATDGARCPEESSK